MLTCTLSLDKVFTRNISLRNQIDCKAGTTAEGQNLLANISTSRASLLQGQYLILLGIFSLLGLKI